MSGYEEEHNISHPPQPSGDEPRHRRPDLSTFFSTLDLIDTAGTDGRAHHNAHAEPLPSDVSSAFRQLANSYQIILGETEGVTLENPVPGAGGRTQNEFLEGMIHMLMGAANDPPRRPHGMPDTYFDELDRVPKTGLKKDDNCPICAIPFLDDKYPLVVQLPCHKDHIFDLDCIKPWLKLQTTCPMCRTDLEKKKEPIKPPPELEDEEEWDDMYA